MRPLLGSSALVIASISVSHPLIVPVYILALETRDTEPSNGMTVRALLRWPRNETSEKFSEMQGLKNRTHRPASHKSESDV